MEQLNGFDASFLAVESANQTGDALHFGLLSCRELIPDLWDLARDFAAGLEALSKAAAARAPSA
jgi:hypothetical protein